MTEDQLKKSIQEEMCIGLASTFAERLAMRLSGEFTHMQTVINTLNQAAASEKDLPGCVHGLDMVHATLWQMGQDCKETGSRIVNEKEIKAMLVIVEAVMRELDGDEGTFFKNKVNK